MKKQNKTKIGFIIALIIVAIFICVPSSVSAAKSPIKKTKISINVGKSYSLKSRNVKKVTWKSNNLKVAMVSSNGKVTGKSVGRTIIRAKSGSKIYKCTVTVKSGETKKIKATGIYTGKKKVAAYIHKYKKLPSNFITKEEAGQRGWKGGSLLPYASNKCIGGDYYCNYEQVLPEMDGRTYYECDLWQKRN